ncbi:MAG: hypothetical protein D8H98_04450 [Prevotella sp.]|nr:MAG: hypothetical protein D8H98_04450 [Prevotella sp.]
MNSREFFDKVSRMRDLQRLYAKNRNMSVLNKCKTVEKEVDAEIARVNAILGIRQTDEPNMFGKFQIK